MSNPTTERLDDIFSHFKVLLVPPANYAPGEVLRIDGRFFEPEAPADVVMRVLVLDVIDAGVKKLDGRAQSRVLKQLLSAVPKDINTHYVKQIEAKAFEDGINWFQSYILNRIKDLDNE